MTAAATAAVTVAVVVSAEGLAAAVEAARAGLLGDGAVVVAATCDPVPELVPSLASLPAADAARAAGARVVDLDAVIAPQHPVVWTPDDAADGSGDALRAQVGDVGLLLVEADGPGRPPAPGRTVAAVLSPGEVGVLVTDADGAARVAARARDAAGPPPTVLAPETLRDWLEPTLGAALRTFAGAHGGPEGESVADQLVREAATPEPRVLVEVGRVLRALDGVDRLNGRDAAVRLRRGTPPASLGWLPVWAAEAGRDLWVAMLRQAVAGPRAVAARYVGAARRRVQRRTRPLWERRALARAARDLAAGDPGSRSSTAGDRPPR